MHCGVFAWSQHPKCPADPTDRSWAISPQIREKTCPMLCDCPWMPVTWLKHPYCLGGPLGTGMWSQFILWKCWVYHFSPIRGTFNLAMWDTNKIKASYSPIWGRRKPGCQQFADAISGETGCPMNLSSKKAAWGLKFTHEWDFPGPRRPHLKEGGDSGAMVSVQAPKPDLPPEVLLSWPKPLEVASAKSRAGGKSLQEAKTKPWSCICLGSPWNRALALYCFFILVAL